MKNKRGKSPADILIEKLDIIDAKRGLPTSKTVDGEGNLIYFPKSDSNVFKYFENKKTSN